MQHVPLIDTYTLRPDEVDVDHLLKLSSLAHYFQNSAWRSADVLGFGYKDLAQYGLAWVLSRLHLKITSYPRWGETIHVHTWPKRIDRLFALRDFLVYSDDEPESPVIQATSAWLLLDVKTKRPRRIESLQQPMVTLDKDAIINTPEKIQLPPSCDHNKSFLVERSHLDVNFHTNNACYIEWIEDAIPMDVYQHKRIHELQVNFIGESFIGDSLTMKYRIDQDCAGHIHNNSKQDIIRFNAGFKPV